MLALHLQPMAGVGPSPRLGHQVLIHGPSPRTPPCWGCCIHFHWALQVMLDLEPGSNLFASNGSTLFCFVPFVYFRTDSGLFPPTFPFFVTAPRRCVLWRWLMLPHVRRARRFMSPWFLGQVGLLQSTAAAGRTDVLGMAALAQSPMRILCP